MIETLVRLDEPKKTFDWQDVIDMMDEVGRQLDKKDKRISELEEQHERDVDFYLRIDKENKYLKSQLEAMKCLIPNMVDERG